MKRTVLIASVLLVAVLIIAGMTARKGNGLLISEVCPHNETVIHDGLGVYHDYIKLYNLSGRAIDLKGYSLSDDRNDIRKYVFPEKVIAPGETLIIWAGEQTVFGAGFKDEESLYTEFGLRDHELLFLSDPYGSVVDSVRLPSLAANEALIRKSADDKGSAGIPSEKEPDRYSVSEDIPLPIMSVVSGYYADPFKLVIDGGMYPVYYTVDSGNPCISGIKYTEPIVIDNTNKCTVVRAVCKREDGICSSETTGSFFVGEQLRNICKGTYTVSIISDPEGLFSDDKGIYVKGSIWERNREQAAALGVDENEAPSNYDMRGSGWRRYASVTLFDPDGKQMYAENSMISIRGRSSRAMAQKGFNLRPALSGQKIFDGLFANSGDTLMLRTGSADINLTGFRDAINSRIAHDLKVCPQESLCCQLYLDGEYWGCYNLQEHLDESFVQSVYGVLSDNINIIKVEGDPEAYSGKSSDMVQYKELEMFVRENDIGTPVNYKKFCDMVDIDSLIDYYSCELFFANDDAYMSNMGLWRARQRGILPYEDGKWRFLLYDLDNTDGYYGTAGADIDSFVDGSWIGYNACDDLFFSGLMTNPDFRKRFRDRFSYLLDNDFSYERIGPILDEFENTYAAPMTRSIQRFEDAGFTEEEYHQNVQVVRDFFRQRGNYMREYLMMHMGD